MSVPLFLCIETATKLCSVALTKGDSVLGQVEAQSDQYIHAESLHPFIEKLFQQVDFEMSDVDAIVVGKGPGSYTGLRIGVSAAKGLSFALHTPVIAVNSLEGIASQAQKNHQDMDYFVPVIDARRDEVYTLLMDNKGAVEKETKAEIIGDEFLEKETGKRVCIVGDASEKVEQLLPSLSNVHYDHNLAHHASNLRYIALERYENKDFEDVAYFEPYYLKEFIAGKPKRQFKKL